jgi:hypothetical protein
LPRELAALRHRRCAPPVNIGDQMDQMDTALGFLARFDAHDRQGDVPSKRFAQEFVYRRMAEKIAAEVFACRQLSETTGFEPNFLILTESLCLFSRKFPFFGSRQPETGSMFSCATHAAV